MHGLTHIWVPPAQQQETTGPQKETVHKVCVQPLFVFRFIRKRKCRKTANCWDENANPGQVKPPSPTILICASIVHHYH